MIALVDIGNTRFKYTFVEDAFIKDISNTQINEKYTEINEYWNESWFEQHLLDVSHVILGNVALKSYEELLQVWCNKKNIILKVVKSQPYYKGVTNGYRKYQQLGVDRWLAVLGASQLCPSENVLIIDSGTATTLDVLDQTGMHHGGWILPGIQMMSSSILSSTSQVKGEIQSISSLSFGLDSSENISHASWAATIGFIEQGVILAKEKMKLPVSILLTGGNGKVLNKLLASTKSAEKIHFIQDLVFVGLSCYIDEESS